MSAYFLAFVPIFVAVDALGMLPIFSGFTQRLDPARRGWLIRQATLMALAVSVAFLFVGKLVFRWLGVTIEDFMVAGGAILFIISIRDLLSYDKAARLPDVEIGVVPLAVPLMVGPAVLTTSLLLLDAYGLPATLFSIIANLLLCGVILHFSSHLSRLLGEGVSQVLTKVSSLLLGSIGVMLMRRGLMDLLQFVR